MLHVRHATGLPGPLAHALTAPIISSFYVAFFAAAATYLPNSFLRFDGDCYNQPKNPESSGGLVGSSCNNYPPRQQTIHLGNELTRI
jgi:hypothetical protein